MDTGRRDVEPSHVHHLDVEGSSRRLWTMAQFFHYGICRFALGYFTILRSPSVAELLTTSLKACKYVRHVWYTSELEYSLAQYFAGLIPNRSDRG